MRLIKSLTLAGMVSVTSFAAAQTGMISGGFTGNWFNADTSGQGFQLQVLPDGKAVAFWFTYDANGNQVWLIGNNDIQGNRLELDMARPVGARFGANFDSDDVQLQPFGTVTMTFDDCNSGTVNWQSSDAQFGSGSMPIERLTSSAGVSCTASVVDNRKATDPVLDFYVRLINEGTYPGAEAEADFESRPNRVEFDVEIEDVPLGTYTLLVDGIERGDIQVRTVDDGTEGEIEFSSPRDDDDVLLDFDPLGALIEVLDGDDIIFSGILDPAFAPPGDDDDDDDDGQDDDSPPFGNSETKVYFTNTGVDTDAYGDAELEQYPGRVEFEVEIEDLDIGIYELWVGGELRAEIPVAMVDDDDDTRGEVEFSDPVEAGKILLDFDPLGQLITIEQDGVIFLSADFPSVPGTGGDDDDDDDGGNDDGGNDDDDGGNDDGGNDDEDDDDDDGEDDEDDDDEDDDDDDEDDDDDDDDDD